jgi:hypothetical protein
VTDHDTMAEPSRDFACALHALVLLCFDQRAEHGIARLEVIAEHVNVAAASLAHPGTTACEHIVPSLVEAGLCALEAYHSAHDAATQARYVRMAREYGLAVTGGSDFHGDGLRRAEFFGAVGVPSAEFERFQARALAAMA